ncbi:MAG: methyltransferase domain-containing protein [Oleibacter sp.]|nr:methyltransferase domain-containing protein [Thalassolituus sp.]
MSMRNKQQVAKQFSRAANSYDKAASVQHYALQQLLVGLPSKPERPALSGHWLDIGCGTGAAFAPLRALGVTTLTGIDLAEGMLSVAKQKQLADALLLADADALPLDDNSIDGVFSNLMLQWSETPLATLQEWRRVLKTDGQLAFTTLLPGTQQELKDAWWAVDQGTHVNEFTAADTLLTSLEQAGFAVHQQMTECWVDDYDDLAQLLRGLKQIGATNVNSGRRSGLGGRRQLQQLAAHYPTRYRDGKAVLPVSYQILTVHATAKACVATTEARS